MPRPEAQMELYCDRLARALSVVINILDPHAIVLGGGPFQDDAGSIGACPSSGSAYVFSEPQFIATRLLPPRFGDSSGGRGAAWLWPAALRCQLQLGLGTASSREMRYSTPVSPSSCVP